MSAFSVFDIPMGVLTDSYKAAHFQMYPDSNLMSAYGEFRTSFQNDPNDYRQLFYGIRYLVENYLSRKWTVEDVERCEKFYSTHNAGYTPYPFPKELFLKFIKENDGYFPVKLEALPEGSVVHVHTPVYQMTASGTYTKLVTFLETILTHVWYPTSVATLSRFTKDHIEEAFEKSVDPDAMFLLNSRLHDFGFRGTTCVEQSVLGGVAHLINFDGSDTMSACYYTQFHLNNGNPIGTSIPATEHSIMTAWPSERKALQHVIKQYGGSVFATVMDSYDYERCLNKVVPSLVPEYREKGGLWVFRPDSGDPVEAVMMALHAGEKAFGVTKNAKGYKVINGAACIQGDGIDRHVVKKILTAALADGFSAQNVAFGMGGGLLQKVNRDTMSFATKLSYIEYADGRRHDVMKLPKTDAGKISLPGILRVKRDPQTGLEVVLPRNPDDSSYDENDLLRPVYDMKPLPIQWEDFSTLRKRVAEDWRKSPKMYDPISKELKAKIANWTDSQKKMLAEEKL